MTENKEDKIKKLFDQNPSLEEELPKAYLKICKKLGLAGGKSNVHAK